MSCQSRRSVFRRLIVAAALAAVATVVLPLLPPLTVAAYQPYYPYPCVFGSGGRNFNGDTLEHDGPSWDPRTGLWDMGASVFAEPFASNTTVVDLVARAYLDPEGRKVADGLVMS